jgi:hypothetical protein
LFSNRRPQKCCFASQVASQLVLFGQWLVRRYLVTCQEPDFSRDRHLKLLLGWNSHIEKWATCCIAVPCWFICMKGALLVEHHPSTRVCIAEFVWREKATTSRPVVSVWSNLISFPVSIYFRKSKSVIWRCLPLLFLERRVCVCACAYSVCWIFWFNFVCKSSPKFNLLELLLHFSLSVDRKMLQNVSTLCVILLLICRLTLLYHLELCGLECNARLRAVKVLSYLKAAYSVPRYCVSTWRSCMRALEHGVRP